MHYGHFLLKIIIFSVKHELINTTNCDLNAQDRDVGSEVNLNLVNLNSQY